MKAVTKIECPHCGGDVFIFAEAKSTIDITDLDTVPLEHER